jgi:hypothetical protein
MADKKSTIQDQVVEPLKAAGEAIKDAGKRVSENSAAFGVKMIDHAEENTRHAFEALRAAAKAGGVTEVLKVQSDYIRDQSSRSMAQAREVGELIANFGRSIVEGVKDKK